MSATIDQTLRMEDRLRAMFDLHDGHALNGSNVSLSGIRKKAIADFEALGLPHRKSEAWKYTPVEKALHKEAQIQVKPAAQSATEAQIASLLIPDLDVYRVVFLNGHIQPALSQLEGLPAKVLVKELHAASSENAAELNKYFAKYADSAADSFIALNTAFAKEGLFVHVGERALVEKPIHIIHLFDTGENEIVQPRMLFVAEAGSEVNVIESFACLSNTNTFVNTVTEWAVSERANVHHYQIQEFNAESTVVSTIHAHQSTHSFFSTHTTSISGRMIRNNLTIVPDAEDCESHLFGLVLGKENMHVDNHTLVDHKKPNCFSNELYKNILDDQSVGVFNGKVFVRPDAQKINAYQSNKSITLTKNAKMYSKPELEIYADDVKCSHGATTGQLDEDAMFYLRARGIKKEQARALLLMAFARDVIENIKIEPLKLFIDNKIENKL
ncbi:MAG: Fe-S cluster assembly protein SufD [Rhodothermales bacterium]